MFRLSVTRKLMLLFFVVGVSVLSVIGTYSYYSAKKAILKRTLDQLTSIRVIKKGQVEFLFNERYKNLTFLAGTDYLRSLLFYLNPDNSDKIDAGTHASNYYNGIKEKINFRMYGFSNMFIVQEDNHSNLIICTVGDNAIINDGADSVTTVLLHELRDKVELSEDICIMDFTKRYEGDTDPVCLIGKKINGENSTDFAMLALQIPISSINNIMLDNSPENGLGRSGEIYLVGQDYLMRSKSRFIENSVLTTAVNTISVRNAFKNETGSSLIDDYRTISCLSSFDKIGIPGLNWVIIAEIDYEEAMIPIVSIRNDILFLSAIICVFLFSVALFISKTITQPVIRLKNAVQNVGKGKFDSPIKTSSGDEIGLLTEAFNTMSLQLKEERQKRMSALFDGQELERQRISRELHDGLGQKLFALKLMIESTAKQNDEKAKQTISEVKGKFSETIDEVRETSNNLAPNILKESGIDIALRNLCESIKNTTDIEVDFSADGDYFTEDEKVKIYIYRIAQEGLTNSVKHSGATDIHLQLIGNKDFIILVLEDNGKGFNIDEKNYDSGNGIYNMKERAHLLFGSLDIETEPGAGTTIRLKIPKKSS